VRACGLAAVQGDGSMLKYVREQTLEVVKAAVSKK
jgi:hypothetical protein